MGKEKRQNENADFTMCLARLEKYKKQLLNTHSAENFAKEKKRKALVVLQQLIEDIELFDQQTAREKENNNFAFYQEHRQNLIALLNLVDEKYKQNNLSGRDIVHQVAQASYHATRKDKVLFCYDNMLNFTYNVGALGFFIGTIAGVIGILALTIFTIPIPVLVIPVLVWFAVYLLLTFTGVIAAITLGGVAGALALAGSFIFCLSTTGDVQGSEGASLQEGRGFNYQSITNFYAAFNEAKPSITVNSAAFYQPAPQSAANEEEVELDDQCSTLTDGNLSA